MSERVERKILALIGEHRESPYGNPIPGLDELGEEPNEAFRLGVTSLLELAGRDAGRRSWCGASASRRRSTTRR